MRFRSGKTWRRGARAAKVFLMLAALEIFFPALNISAAPDFRALSLTAFFNQTNSALLPEKATLRGGRGAARRVLAGCGDGCTRESKGGAIAPAAGRTSWSA
jgi:hypothetical protein